MLRPNTPIGSEEPFAKVGECEGRRLRFLRAHGTSIRSRQLVVCRMKLAVPANSLSHMLSRPHGLRAIFRSTKSSESFYQGRPFFQMSPFDDHAKRLSVYLHGTAPRAPSELHLRVLQLARPAYLSKKTLEIAASFANSPGFEAFQANRYFSSAIRIYKLFFACLK